MPTYLNADVFRTRTNIPTAVTEATLKSILDGVEVSVEMALGYNPLGGSVVRYLTGDGTQKLVFPDKQVLSITEVREDADGAFGDNGDAYGTATILTAGEGYAVEVVSPDGVCVLHRLGGVWPYRQWRGYRRLANSKVPCEGSVMVTAVVDDVPADIREAGYLEAIARYGTASTGIGAQTSSSLDARSVSVTPFQRGSSATPYLLSPAAEIILRSRRRTAVY